MLQDTPKNALPAHTNTTFAIAGDRAGADDLLIAFSANLTDDLTPLVIEVHPDQGHNFLLISAAASVGAIAGMNDAGLVLCVTRNASFNPPTQFTPNPALIVRHLLETTTNYYDALAQLQTQSNLDGYTFLLAAIGEGKPRVTALNFAAPLQMRAPDNGLLLGVAPEDNNTDKDTRARYDQIAQRVAQERIIGVRETQSILADSANNTQQAENTRAQISIVFEPKRNRMHIASPAEDPTFTTHTLSKKSSP